MPERTCVACRGKSDKRSMLRIVRRGASRDAELEVQSLLSAGLLLDPLQRLRGRGVYCHFNVACLFSSKLFFRAKEILGRRSEPREIEMEELSSGFRWAEGEGVDKVLSRVGDYWSRRGEESSRRSSLREQEASEQFQTVLEEIKRRGAETVSQHKGRVRIRL